MGENVAVEGGTLNRFVSLALLFAAASASAADAPRTIDVNIHRQLPPAAAREDLPAEQKVTLPIIMTGCEAKLSVASIDYNLSIQPSNKQIVIKMIGTAVLHKTLKGPMAAPILLIKEKAQNGEKTLSVFFEEPMLLREWEAGGDFPETFADDAMVDAKFWTSLELRCPSGSPYRPSAIPKNVTYHNGDEAKVAATVEDATVTIGSESGYGAPSLYDGLVIIGPTLYEALRHDPAMAKIESPKMVTIDPATGKSREMLRAKGNAELAIIGETLRRYLGPAPPRFRAATFQELAQHWVNIGWDIEEPLLVADYGTHKLVLDFAGTHILMIDEVK